MQTPSDLELDATVQGSPQVVRGRLDAGLLGMSSLWFPSLAEMRRWDGATEVLYVRWPSETSFEIGPRLVNLQAARFCPVVVGSLHAVGTDQTRLTGTVHFPRFSAGLLGLWGLLLTAWLVAGLMGQEAAHGQGWMVGWLVLAGAAVAAGGLGHLLGGRALRTALPELVRVAGDPGAGADDW